jgi:hypothetical protein
MENSSKPGYSRRMPVVGSARSALAITGQTSTPGHAANEQESEILGILNDYHYRTVTHRTAAGVSNNNIKITGRA